MALISPDLKCEEILEVYRTIIKTNSCVLRSELDITKVHQNHQQQQ